MHPLIYGRSRLVQGAGLKLKDCINSMGRGDIISAPPESQTEVDGSRVFSNHFQLLPSEVEFHEKRAK